MKRVNQCCLLAVCLMLSAGTSAAASRALSDALSKQAADMVSSGATFLAGRQQPDGSWLAHPAITSLACTALMNCADAEREDLVASVDRGLDYVKRHARTDGAIWNRDTEQYPNYSTAISLTALILKNREQDRDIIRRARNFLLNTQSSDVSEDDPSYGGIGYGKKLRPDLSNTQWALEALYLTDHLDREPFNTDAAKAEKADLAWARAREFLSRCQNLAETNDQAWVVSDPDNRGGFVYMPGESKAGAVEQDEGLGLRSYGSMTYAGLKSMIYAQIDRDDVRVKAAVGWIQRHFTFAENPGLGAAGYYYYLHTCAKALAAYGRDTISDIEGNQHDWRQELVQQLRRLQKPEGYWVNTNGRWWETVPELTTAYAVLALEVAVARD